MEAPMSSQEVMHHVAESQRLNDECRGLLYELEVLVQKSTTVRLLIGHLQAEAEQHLIAAELAITELESGHA